MKRKIIAVAIIIAIVAALTVGFVNAASISATLSVQQSGTDVITAPQGSTVTLLCSFTISPSATATGTVYYRYSSDGGVTFGPETTITTFSAWDGSQRTVDFVLSQEGSYVFFLKVESGFDSAVTHYPASGTFSSTPPSPLPEAPPIAGLAIGFAALGVFVVVVKKRKQTQPTSFHSF